MTVALDVKCAARIKAELVEVLRQARVNYNQFLSDSAIEGLMGCDRILPQHGQVRDQLTQIVGELPLFTFVYQTLNRELAETNDFDSDVKDRPLSEYERYRSVEETADRLVADLLSLPKDYVVTLELPSSLDSVVPPGASEVNLSDQVRLVRITEEFESEHPLNASTERQNNALFGGPGLLGIFSGFTPRQWRSGGIAYQSRMQGFMGRYGNGPPVDRALSNLRSFMGVGIGARLLTFGQPADRALAIGREAALYMAVHECAAGGLQIHSTHALSQDLADSVKRLKVDDLDSTVSAEHLPRWTAKNLRIVSAAFRGGGRAEHVMRGGRWLLDSYSGENELLSFIRATVAIEIMLGEESQNDVLGIGELLSNRCAYSIGKSRRQRDNLLADFKEIYRVRSKIVHRGKEQLTSEERGHLQRLQWMCARVLQEELNLLIQDEERPNRS